MSLSPKRKTGDALKPHLLLGKWSKLLQIIRSEIRLWTILEAGSEGRMKLGENCSYSSYVWLCPFSCTVLHHSAWTPGRLLPAADRNN